MIPQLVQDVATCVCSQFEGGNDPELAFCGIIPGEAPIMEYAGDCRMGTEGMVWVRLDAMYPAATPGVPYEQPQSCDVGLGLELEVGALRCMPLGGNQGDPPTPAELLETSMLQMRDAQTIYQGLACCSELTHEAYRIGTWSPLGPQQAGGLVGGTWTVAVVI